MQKEKNTTQVINEFTIGLQNQIVDQNKPAYMFSGMSAYLALSMLQEGTSGVCLAELEEKVGIPSSDTHRSTVLASIQETMAQLKESTCSYLLANGLFLKNDDIVKQYYKECLKSCYKAELGGLNKDLINKWVSDNTNAKITDLISEISPNDVAILVNAIYFKANWKEQFPKKNTKERTFKQNGVEGTTKMVQMMSMNKKLCYKRDRSGNTYLKLDYENCNLSMVFLLPPQDKPLEHSLDTEEKMLSVTDWHQRPQECNATIPLFEVESEFNIKEMLQDKGVKHIFSDGPGKFDKMFDNRPDIFVGAIQQKSYIKVNEEGTEAVAATKAVMIMRCMPPPPMDFILDRPFSFYIIDTRCIIYFNGAINSL